MQSCWEKTLSALDPFTAKALQGFNTAVVHTLDARPPSLPKAYMAKLWFLGEMLESAKTVFGGRVQWEVLETVTSEVCPDYRTHSSLPFSSGHGGAVVCSHCYWACPPERPLSNRSDGLWNRTLKIKKQNNSPICEIVFCYFLSVMESWLKNVHISK